MKCRAFELPTFEFLSFTFQVLFQADSSSISLQYAEQNGANRALFKSRDRYIWKHDKTSTNAWSECSVTCGKGRYFSMLLKVLVLDESQNVRHLRLLLPEYINNDILRHVE